MSLADLIFLSYQPIALPSLSRADKASVASMSDIMDMFSSVYSKGVVLPVALSHFSCRNVAASTSVLLRSGL